MIPKTRTRDVLADRRRPAISDLRSRYQQYVSRYYARDDEVSTGVDSHEITLHEAVRVRSVEISSVAGGTVSMDVYVTGASNSLFDGTNFPTSGAGPQDTFRLYPLPAGTVLTIVAAGTTGAPSGTMNIIVNTEPLELLPQFEDPLLRGPDRLHVSRRTEAQRLDAVDRSTIRVATDQTERGRGQVEQVRNRVGRNARSLIYPNRYAFRGGQRAR